MQATCINSCLYEMLLEFADKNSEIFKNIEKLKLLAKDSASYDMKHYVIGKDYAMRARYTPWRHLNFGPDFLDRLRDLPKNLKIIVLQHVNDRLFAGVFQKTLPPPVQAAIKKKDAAAADTSKDPGFKSVITWIPADVTVLQLIKKQGYTTETMSAVAEYLAPIVSFFNNGNSIFHII